MGFIDEADWMCESFKDFPELETFRHNVQHWFRFSESAFTELDYYRAATDLLFYCRDIDRMRVCLPCSIISGVPACGVATRVLANTLKALAQRPEEDSAPLRALAIDAVTDTTMCELWMNPTDVMNMHSLLPYVHDLALGVRRLDESAFSAAMFGVAFWNTVCYAATLRSLCLTVSRERVRGHWRTNGHNGSFEVTNSAELNHSRWLEVRFPAPGVQLVPPRALTYLDLKYVSLLPDDLLRIATALGPALEELHMCGVFLMTRQSIIENTQSDMHLWVGLPNQDPGERMWMATRLRPLLPRLRILRCSDLSYSLFLEGTTALSATFDFADPAGLGRTVSQRFVEVVMGIAQPRRGGGDSNSGEPLCYHPHDPALSGLVNVSERRERIPIAEHDYQAHRLAVTDPHPDHQRSLDGLFPNCEANSQRELQYIRDKLVEGADAIHRRNEKRCEEERRRIRRENPLAHALVHPDARW